MMKRATSIPITATRSTLYAPYGAHESCTRKGCSHQTISQLAAIVDHCGSRVSKTNYHPLCNVVFIKICHGEHSSEAVLHITDYSGISTLIVNRRVLIRGVPQSHLLSPVYVISASVDTDYGVTWDSPVVISRVDVKTAPRDLVGQLNVPHNHDPTAVRWTGARLGTERRGITATYRRSTWTGP